MKFNFRKLKNSLLSLGLTATLFFPSSLQAFAEGPTTQEETLIALRRVPPPVRGLRAREGARDWVGAIVNIFAQAQVNGVLMPCLRVLPGEDEDVVVNSVALGEAIGIPASTCRERFGLAGYVIRRGTPEETSTVRNGQVRTRRLPPLGSGDSVPNPPARASSQLPQAAAAYDATLDAYGKNRTDPAWFYAAVDTSQWAATNRDWRKACALPLKDGCGYAVDLHNFKLNTGIAKSTLLGLLLKLGYCTITTFSSRQDLATALGVPDGDDIDPRQWTVRLKQAQDGVTHTTQPDQLPPAPAQLPPAQGWFDWDRDRDVVRDWGDSDY